MLNRPTRVILAALLAASFTAGCNKEKAPATAPAAQQAAGEPAPDTVVATFGDGQKITYKELSERLQEPLANLEKQKSQLLKRGLDGMVTEKLVDAEAKKRGLSQEAYLKAEIDDKVPAPTEERIKEVYDGAAGQLPEGSTYEQMKPQIVEFLTQQPKQERAQALFEELRKSANVKLTLPEPPRPPVVRKQVAATGAAKGGPEGAPVTIVEFSDFQCPFCSRANRRWRRCSRSTATRSASCSATSRSTSTRRRRRPPRPRCARAIRASSGRCTTCSSPTSRRWAWTP